MQVVGIEGRTAWRALRPAWEEAYAADPHAEVFVSFAWLDSWLQIAPQRWFVLAARPSSSEQPVAFLPLALHERRRWGVPLLRELSMAGKPHAPLTGLVVQLHRPRAVHLVSNEALGLVHEMNALPKTVFEVDFVALGYGDSIGDAEHARIIPASRPA